MTSAAGTVAFWKCRARHTVVRALFFPINYPTNFGAQFVVADRSQEDTYMRNEEALWSIEDVATYLGVPVGSVYKMTAETARLRIPHLKIGGRLRFRKADIDRWLDLLLVSNLETLAKAKRLAQRG